MEELSLMPLPPAEAAAEDRGMNLTSMDLGHDSSNATAGDGGGGDPGDFQFNRRLLMNVLAYSVMCVVGSIGNAIVFVAAYKQHVSPENQHGRRNNVHIMVVHLTIADLVVSFVVMPLEIGWRLSVQWVAGNAACKLLMFIRAFAFYLSSATLVCLSLDRYIAIAQPMATLKMNVTRRRGRIMILLAWLAAGVFALPQTFVFRVLKHPEVEFYQCTSMGFFSQLLNGNLSNPMLGIPTGPSNDSVVNGSAVPTNKVLGLGPDDLERIYSSIFLVAVYMVPLLVIVVTYANILAKIVRKRRASSETANANSVDSGGGGGGGGGGGRHNSQGNLLAHEGDGDSSRRISHAGSGSSRRHFHRRDNSGTFKSGTNSSLMCRNRQLRFARSQTVALRMSTLHVLAFVGCWTPYLVISAWHIVDPEGVGNDVSPEIQDALFLTAVFNSCINPLVYGGFYFRALKKSRERQRQREREMYLQSHHSVMAPNTPSKLGCNGSSGHGSSFKANSSVVSRHRSHRGHRGHHAAATAATAVVLEPGSSAHNARTSSFRLGRRNAANNSSVSSSATGGSSGVLNRETSFRRP